MDGLRVYQALTTRDHNWTGVFWLKLGDFSISLFLNQIVIIANSCMMPVRRSQRV
jgi:hypothetical protein